LGASEMTMHWAGITAVLVFLVAYAAVAGEERLHLRKSVPVLSAAGIIWVAVGIAYAERGQAATAAELARHNILDFAEIFLFLLVAMTFVNTITERGVFGAVRAWLAGRGFSQRWLFWATGALAFVISPIADNLTTALVVGAVVVAVGAERPRFVALACINVVVAANAGGVFSPFGDITTLMVWQSGAVSFTGFFPLALPSLVNWLVPAICMSLALGPGQLRTVRATAVLETGAITVVGLFLGTIALTVSLHNLLHLPSALGMMFGLGILKLYSYALERVSSPMEIETLEDVFVSSTLDDEDVGENEQQTVATVRRASARKPLRTFELMEKIEWDTLIFFYGVILAVGGLGAMGYLTLVSIGLYGGFGATSANVAVGLISAIVDNVPVMFAVLSMGLDMSHGQWLLVTLTTGVGGSLLSIGSAAGVALMGLNRDAYTFVAHLRWSWAIALGYAASIATHLVINRHLF